MLKVNPKLNQSSYNLKYRNAQIERIGATTAIVYKNIFLRFVKFDKNDNKSTSIAMATFNAKNFSKKDIALGSFCLFRQHKSYSQQSAASTRTQAIKPIKQAIRAKNRI